jgi:hypothetical protein
MTDIQILIAVVAVLGIVISLILGGISSQLKQQTNVLEDIRDSLPNPPDEEFVD